MQSKKKLKEKKDKLGKNKITQVVAFPSRVLEPIKNFLSKEQSELVKRKEGLAEEDPFTDVRRLSDSASPDSDAAEQVGHERVLALRQEVDRRLIQVRKAMTRIKIGKYGICEKCGQMIDTDRLMIMPETTLCIQCERKREK
jgi:DnaK suppressor protein